MMENEIVITRPRRTWTKRLVRFVLPAVLLLFLASLIPDLPSPFSFLPQASVQDDSLAIEERYGIRIRRVAALAGGGIIELRFLIVDPDKANLYMHDPEYMPALVADGIRLEPPERGHDMEYKAGWGYYILYGNHSSAVKSGKPVVIDFDGLRQEVVAN